MPLPHIPTIHDSQQPNVHDVSFLSLSLISLFLNHFQVTIPLFPTTRHPRFHSNHSTAQVTAICASDHSRYTRDPPHVQIHAETQRWPNHNPVSTTLPRSPSPEFPPHLLSRQQPEHVAGPSSLPDNDQLSSPLTSSPHASSPSTEHPPQSTSFDKSLESNSGKKRHKCDVCGSYWGRPSSLKIHMVSHTGKKGPFFLFFGFYPS
jgi:hypothetical protein